MDALRALAMDAEGDAAILGGPDDGYPPDVLTGTYYAPALSRCYAIFQWRSDFPGCADLTHYWCERLFLN